MRLRNQVAQCGRVRRPHQVAEEQDAAGPRQSSGLVQNLARLGNVMDDAVGDNRIECVIDFSRLGVGSNQRYA